MSELKKLRTMSPMSAEATVVRNYLDWLLSIPWKKRSKVKNDLALAQKVLDADPLWPREGKGASSSILPCRRGRRR